MSLRALVLCVLFATLSAPVRAEESALRRAFEEACLAVEGGFAPLDRFARSIGAHPDPGAPLTGFLPPLVVASDARRWTVGDPLEKAPSDLLLVVSLGAVMNKPAEGCLVLGYADSDLAETVLADFAASRFIGKTKGSIGPSYRHWLIDGPAGPAIYGAARLSGWPPESGEPGLALTLVRPYPGIIDRLVRGM